VTTSTMSPPPIVSREEWLAARKALLAKEKAMTRELDALRAERRRLPWVKVETPYVQGNRIRNFLARLSDSDSTEELFGAHGGWDGRISGMLFRGGGSAVRQRAAA